MEGINGEDFEIKNHGTNFHKDGFGAPLGKVVNFDLLNLKILKKIFKNANLVYHLAANADVRWGLNHPKKDLEQNSVCTFNVLEAMRYNSIKKIVQHTNCYSLNK